jgi:hypothetical protein
MSNAPDYVWPILAYRCWWAEISLHLSDFDLACRPIRFDRDLLIQQMIEFQQPLLLSVNIGSRPYIPSAIAVWIPRVEKVACCYCKDMYGAAGGDLDSDFDRHRCGIYAFKDWHNAVAAYEPNVVSFDTPKQDSISTVYTIRVSVCGEVWLWGDVIEHEIGYRATNAYPACFYDFGMVVNRASKEEYVVRQVTRNLVKAFDVDYRSSHLGIRNNVDYNSFPNFRLAR